ncbi:MAG: class I SAM-dependent methyltransferase [Pseudomonadota bacterium]
MPASLKTKILRRLERYAGQCSAAASSRLVDGAVDKAGFVRARDIPTHMTRGELDALYTLATQLGPTPRILEIGSYLGASSRFLAAALPAGGKLFCVDTWNNETMPEGTRETLPEFERNVAAFAGRIVKVRKDSKDLAASDIELPLDLVFIDGDHSFAAVRRDFDAVAPWVADAKFVAFHDTTYFRGVSRVLGQALDSGQWQMGGHIDSLVWLRKAAGQAHDFPNE